MIGCKIHGPCLSIMRHVLHRSILVAFVSCYGVNSVVVVSGGQITMVEFFLASCPSKEYLDELGEVLVAMAILYVHESLVNFLITLLNLFHLLFFVKLLWAKSLDDWPHRVIVLALLFVRNPQGIQLFVTLCTALSDRWKVTL